jgi:hypothetical protein
VFKRLRFAEKLAAVSALALFGALFLDWFGVFGVEGAYFNRSVGAAKSADVVAISAHGISGWHSLGWLALALCVLAILAGLALPLIFGLHESPVLPVLAAILTTVFGGLAIIALLVQVIFQPGDDATTTLSSGWWLGLIATAGIARGGFLSMREEHLPGVAVKDVEVRPAPPAEPAA